MMTEMAALTGVYPNFADKPARLDWNRRREFVLRQLPGSDDVDLLLKITRRRIALLERLA